MSDDEITSLTLRMPQALRDRIKVQAKLEERTESQFVRFHLSELLGVNPEIPAKGKLPQPATR